MDYVEVKNVTKRFQKFVSLDKVSISFEQGKIHGIIGRNGSGKTVLFKCICGFMHPEEGEILVGGKRIGKDVDMVEGAGIIIEAPGFLPGYSGFRNLMFLAQLSGGMTKDEIKRLLKLVGLNPADRKPVSKYSMGMRQRLGIAQAIMENPSLLILDEPMNGLDNQGVEDIRELLLKLKAEGKTILLASHNREDISVLCDTVAEIDRGKMIGSGRKEITFAGGCAHGTDRLA